MADSIDSNPMKSSITLLVAPKAEIWKHQFEIYKLKADRSIMTCDMVYGIFYKLLKSVRKDIAKGSYMLGEIFLELKVMGKSRRCDNINTTELEFFSTKILEVFQSQDVLILKNKLDSRANDCNATVDNQMKNINERKKIVNRVVSLSLLTAGLGFAGFAAAVGTSAHFMTFDELKCKILLGATSGSLFLVSTLQLAEYLEYNDNFNGIIHNLSELRHNLTSLITAVKLFSAELTELIEQIKQYSQETRMDTRIIGHFLPNSKFFSAKIDEMADKIKNLQIALVKMEISVNEGVDFIKAGKSGLTTKTKRSQKTYPKSNT